MQLQNFWRIVTPASRKQLYTTLSVDAYDPRTTDLSSLTAVTWYSQVLRGLGTRVSSYKQYDSMDIDIDVARSLDIIAEEMSGKDEKTDLPFEVIYQKEDNEDISDMTVITLRQAVRQWSTTQDFNRRIFSIARCLIKYGDCFFRKLSDTKKWTYIDPSLIHGIEVDQLGNRVAYHIKKPSNVAVQYGVNLEQHEIVPAAAIIHFTLSDEMGDSAPFGQSILRSIHRTHKQLSMLEDAVIIYRIVRAPERRVFYIDVGNMPPQRVKQYLEQIKNEMRQKRAPGTAGGKNIVDSAFDPQCLALDTCIPLLDGRTLSLSELIAEHEQGKQNWVYSCDPVTGEIKPGEISWAGVTRKSAELVKVHLDNGETITCTPDHMVPILGVGFIRADLLQVDQSLISYVTEDRTISKSKTKYRHVFDHKQNRFLAVHTLVNQAVHGAFTAPSGQHAVTHHKDFNPFNNAPNNLIWMGHKDHFKYHSSLSNTTWCGLSEEQYQQRCNNISIGTRSGVAALSSEKKSEMAAKQSVSIKASYKIRKVDIDAWNIYLSKLNGPRGARPNISAKLKGKPTPMSNQPWRFTIKSLQALVEAVKIGGTKKAMALQTLRTTPELLAVIAAENQPDPLFTTYKLNTTSFSDKALIRLFEQFNIPNWTYFVKKVVPSFNHRIVKIELLSERQDTGCITIGESVHAWHTFATAAGVFVKNSIQEDIFMPVTAAGRGSRVETLPGGTEDFGNALLRQFQDKIFRGLRIPTSYMTGQDGAQAQYNDGKVGIAYIEELRFAQFIRRLQDRLDEVFDQEFKIYLKVLGLKIDDEVFSIKLPDPANFALYRQAALDADLIASYNNISGDKTISRRFMQKRYLGLTDDEIQMNEAMLKEERSILENANVPPLQQLYDYAVYDNREAIAVEAAVVPEEGSPGEGGFEEEPEAAEEAEPGFFAGGGEEAAPPEEEAPAPAGTATPAPAA